MVGNRSNRLEMAAKFRDFVPKKHRQAKFHSTSFIRPELSSVSHEVHTRIGLRGLVLLEMIFVLRRYLKSLQLPRQTYKYVSLVPG